MPEDVKSNQRNSDEIYLLIKAFQDHQDIDALKKLVLHYEKLVDSIARKYSRGQVLHEDFFQVGMLGLLASFHRYDPSFGRTFESYASLTINGEIKRYLRDKTWSVHVPRRIKELTPKIRRTIDELTIKLQRTPNVKEIANNLHKSEKEIIETLEMGKGYNAISIHQSVKADLEDDGMTLLDMIGKIDEGFEEIDRKIDLEQNFRLLNEREKHIIQATIFEELSQKETGEQLGISQMHVSRLQRKAIKKLQEVLVTNAKKCKE